MSGATGLACVTRRLFVAVLVAACLALAGGGVASAQEDVQTLPDPNATPAPGDDGANGSSDDSQGTGGSGGEAPRADALPETGISAMLLATVGLTLAAAGIAARPIARRRRRYGSDTWVELVRAGPG